MSVALFNRLAAAVVFTNPALRRPDAVAANRLGQPGLWPHAISGDRPIVLVRVAAADDESLVRQLVQWHAYARRRGLDPDLVILDERPAAPTNSGPTSRPALPARCSASRAGFSSWTRARSRPTTRCCSRRRRGPCSAVAVAPWPISSTAERPAAALPPTLPISQPAAPEPLGIPPMPPVGLRFWNGFGGFANDGREYVILIDGTAPGGPALPPAPWTNVLANPGFGCLVTEAGLGYSWAGNSQLNRLTPWSNDPVSDPPGEVVYLRDEDTGALWTPTPLPRGSGAAVIVRHGQGYTRYSRRSHGLEQDLLVLVPPDDPIKLVCLSVRNLGDRTRRLSATFYAEWVLGSLRDNAPLQVVCERDVESGAVLARNVWAGDFAGSLAFAAVGSRPHSFTADRTEFLGRHGSPAAPAALGRAGLSGRVGPALDPCAALLTPILLAPGQAEEIVFVLGQADTLERVRASHGFVHRPRSGPGSIPGGPAIVGPDPGCRPGDNARCRRGLDGQPLAPLPGLGLPCLGPVGVLPIGRSVRLSRSAPGRHGPGLWCPEVGAGPDPAGGGEAVRGRRCPALVASAVGPRRPHAHHRRPVLLCRWSSTTTSP